jgi:lipopolysaccharide transport system ATP-binding protein
VGFLTPFDTKIIISEHMTIENQNTPIISLSEISKEFKIFDSEKSKFLNMLNNKWGQFRTFNALSNISFDILKGQTVGLVGCNGAGKSTLLQILCGTLEPCSGTMSINGKIGALLELGAGFNPEYTGIENAKFYCSLMGLSKNETEKRLPSILEFADIGDFIDQPVKTYSSGMFVRLAFSVVIHVEPEILIVDEALAVGDEAFQAKCHSKINQLKLKGTTIFFVSHSAQSVISLCDRAILLDHGELLMDGDPKTVIAHYQKLLYTPQKKREEFRLALRNLDIESYLKANEQSSNNDKPPIINEELVSTKEIENLQEDYFDESLITQPVTYDNKGAEISDAHIKNRKEERVNVIQKKGNYRICYRVSFNRDVANVRFTFMIKQANGTHLGGGLSAPRPESGIDYISANTSLDVAVEFTAMLNPAVYLANAAVYGDVGRGNEFIGRMIDVLMFRIQPYDECAARESIDFNFSFIISPTSTERLN